MVGRPVVAGLCPWLKQTFDLDALAVRDLGLLVGEDREIFERARAEADVVMTKDRDFAELLERLGPPPEGNLDYGWQYIEPTPQTCPLSHVG